MEVGPFRRFITAIVTVSPSRHFKVGPGIEPLIALAIESRPVTFTGMESMVNSKWVPVSMDGVWGTVSPKACKFVQRSAASTPLAATP
jgi:hypothetical protein